MIYSTFGDQVYMFSLNFIVSKLFKRRMNKLAEEEEEREPELEKVEEQPLVASK